MDSRLFTNSEEKQKTREEATAKALISCDIQRKKLTECFQKSWIGWCGEEQKRFWICFNKV